MQANFQRESEMGSGTYGVVYSARSPSGRRSAIKYNLKSHSCDFAGCIRELNINHQLSLHPHVIPLTRIAHGEPFIRKTRLRRKEGITRDTIHFVYPLAVGNLGNFLSKRSDITMPELHRYMVELLLAVEYVHGMGYIHRDIKTDNVLVMNEGGRYTIKLGDFGLAKPYNQYQTMTPGVMTCSYRAPEVVLGSTNYTQRADIWSVACVIFEMVAGYPLINTCNNDDSVVLQVMSTSLPYRVSSELLSFMDRNGISRNVNWIPREGDVETYLGLKPGGGSIFSCCGGLALFWNFFLHMLCFDPRVRYSASDALNHKWCVPYREYIALVRKNFVPNERDYPPYEVVHGEHRNYVMMLVMDLWRSRGAYPWYQHQILFHSLVVMDRAIFHGIDVDNDNISSPLLVPEHSGSLGNQYPTIVSSSGSGGGSGKGPIRITYLVRGGVSVQTVDPNCCSSYLRRKIELLYLCSLYLAVKYFTGLRSSTTFAEVAGPNYNNKYYIQKAEEYEKWLLSSVLNYDYYRPTPYDIMCRRTTPSDEDVYSLLFFMAVGHQERKNSTEALEFWQRHRKYYDSVSSEYWRSMCEL